MSFRVTAIVAPGLLRDPHKLARIDRAVGRERAASWHPRGQAAGCIAWDVGTLEEALRVRALLEQTLLAALDHTGVNRDPDAMLRSVKIGAGRETD
jgi:hypothetical protein